MKCGEIVRGAAWALVSGAGSGIGRCYALQLAALGYRVVLIGERAERLDVVKTEIEAAGGIDVRTCSLDLARTTAAQRLRERFHRISYHGSFANSSRILRGRSGQCLQHFMSTEYIRAMQ